MGCLSGRKRMGTVRWSDGGVHRRSPYSHKVGARRAVPLQCAVPVQRMQRIRTMRRTRPAKIFHAAMILRVSVGARRAVPLQRMRRRARTGNCVPTIPKDRIDLRLTQVNNNDMNCSH